MKLIENIPYNAGYPQDEKRMLDIYLPDNTENVPVFVYFHGGGLEAGCRKDLNDTLAKTLAAKGIAVVNADYRLMPEAQYPDFINDVADCVKWTAENICNYCTPTGIYVGGSSAGGYLSMMLCFDKQYLRERCCEDAVKGYFHDAGQPTKHYSILSSMGYDKYRIIVDETAPLYHVNGEDIYPPMHFVVSDNDIKNRYEQTMLMLSVLRNFGHGEKVTHTIMHGKHCQYVREQNENGENKLALMVADFISKCEEK
ncbi:MAG: alpha/beta hydrolase [Clostridia bacterium]|nr:alpha/beta hydrolase [Clostridia bacterium]